MQWCGYFNPRVLIYLPLPHSLLVTISLFSVSVSLFLFYKKNSHVSFFFFEFHIYKQYHMIFVFLCLTSVSMIISRSIRVAENGLILTFSFVGLGCSLNILCKEFGEPHENPRKTEAAISIVTCQSWDRGCWGLVSAVLSAYLKSVLWPLRMIWGCRSSW